jgi:hypothetical protein
MLSRPQGHGAAGKIRSMKKSIDTIGNRTREFPACSAVPQPTVPPRAPLHQVRLTLIKQHVWSEIMGNKRIKFIKDHQMHINFMDIPSLYYGP